MHQYRITGGLRHRSETGIVFSGPNYTDFEIFRLGLFLDSFFFIFSAHTQLLRHSILPRDGISHDKSIRWVERQPQSWMSGKETTCAQVLTSCSIPSISRNITKYHNIKNGAMPRNNGVQVENRPISSANKLAISYDSYHMSHMI